MNSAYLGGLVCPRCGREASEADAFVLCPSCVADGQHVNSMPRYDVRRLGADWSPDSTEPGIFRYRELLPIAASVRPVSLGEGGTPLISVPFLADRSRVGELYVKDESRNPTWSYKDRLAAVGVTKAREAGADTVVVSSTGNHGAAAAAYAAAAGMRCIALTLESVPLTMKVLMQSFGAHVVALRNGPDRWTLMREAVREHGWVPLSGFVNPPAGSNPFAVDGYKTMAYEIVETLGRCPDVVITPVAYGDGITGLHRGFLDLLALGQITRLPRLVAAEVFGAYENALRTGSPGTGSVVTAGPSVAFSIATPVSAFQGWQAITASGGTAVAVPDDAEIIRAQLSLAAATGLYLEASAALPIAALEPLSARGALSTTDTVVCIGTSTGLKDVGPTAGELGPVPVIEPSLRALEKTMA
ncbi:MAG: threonine synthase [Actinomycetota bacterium]|nr:threonine synthase [Actinomycetota bacterium]